MNFFKLLFIPIVLITINVKAQDDLDEIFDDGSVNGWTFALGTEVLTNFAGVPNVFVAGRDDSGISVIGGVGILSLGYLLDTRTFFNSFFEENQYKNIENGLYYSLGASYIPDNVIYYADFRSWSANFDEALSPGLISLKRRRISVGSGYRYDFFYDRIAAELRTGFFLGREINNDSNKFFQRGFDFRLSIEYVF